MITERRLAAILSADVAGYSRLMGEDEAGTLDRLKAHRAEFIDLEIAARGGRIVKLMGDGALVEFPSVVDAVDCAVAIQRGMAGRNADVPEDKRIAFRIGVNLGDVIIDGDDIYGDGVNLAARIQEIAEPGGVALSAIAHDQVAGKVEAAFEDAGERELKNITKPVRVYRWTESAAVSEAPPPLPDKPSIAVLPFDNMSGDPEQEYFSDGITEDIITELSRFRELFVIARNSSFAYKGQSVNVGKIGQELGVAYVVEGSVRKAGNRVRITAQLVEAASGNHLWAERYDRELEDIFAVQDEVVQAVAAAIPGNLDLAAREQSKQKPPESLTAYECTLLGIWEFQRGGNNEWRALAAFEKAVEIDPTYARAWSGIAFIYFYLPFSDAMPVDEAASKARRAAERALALDDNDALVHAFSALAYLTCGEYDRAKSHSDRAIELNPNSPTVIVTHGVVLGFLGAPAEGHEWIDKAIRLNPVKPGGFLETLSDNLYMQRNYEGSIEALLRWRTPPFHVHANLAACYAQLGRMDEAAAAKAKFEAARPDDYDIAVAVAINERLCKFQEDRDHWTEGFRKAGFEV